MEERLEREDMWRLLRLAKRDRDMVTNHEWILAYDNFILACSVLDAFMARSTGPSSTPGQPYPLSAGMVDPVPSGEPCCQGNCACTDN
jgi:hypothetical protein